MTEMYETAVALLIENITCTKILCILPTQKLVEVKDSLMQFGHRRIFTMRNIYRLPLNLEPIPVDIAHDRILFLANLKSPDGIFLVEDECLKFKIISPDELISQILTLEKNSKVSFDELAVAARKLGFKESLICSSKQTYANKGQIFDIAPNESLFGIRIERSNDYVVDLSFFDLTSQRLIKKIDKVSLLPQVELNLLTVQQSKLEKFVSLINPEVFIKVQSFLKKPSYCEGLENFNLILNTSSELLNYFSTVFIDPDSQKKIIQQTETSISEIPDDMRSELFHATSQTQTGKTINFRILKPKKLRKLNFTRGKKSLKESLAFLNLLNKKCLSKNYKIFVFVDPKFDIERAHHDVKKLLNAEVIAAESICDALRSKANNFCIEGTITTSVETFNPNFLFVKYSQIQNRPKFRKQSITNFSLILDQLNGYHEGDFVVHKDFGVAKFLGLEFKVLNGLPIELIKLQFNDSVLYLPVEKINLIEKYASFNTISAPKLDSLSKKNTWNEKKKQAAQLASEFASTLLKTFATRKLARGFSYRPIGEMDEIFRNDFEFTETLDQIKATEEAFADLESEKLMDRLICGDTGFGKTEVALRVAFRVLSNGKQVAVLSPTNLLCEQNFQLFEKRLSKFGFKVGKLNNFCSSREKLDTIKRFNQEQIHCLVATTSLFNPKIAPTNLGLLIIDEEHKFGVRHKEKIGNFPQLIDKLYLSATPLPRTLNLVMNDLRSISLIITPPENRKKHFVVINQFDWKVVERAVIKEIQRGGQVLFVVSEIRKIKNYLEKLKALIEPSLVDFIHGKMLSKNLESAFRKFLGQKTRVLVATSIVEAGLDLPNANTLIVADSENFGLSQLYQLKGRVGRSSQQAFVYFLFTDITKLSTAAKSRMQALTELGQLGESFRLALRDMEIRGVGTLLGKAQKGKVDLVGFDTFLELVKEAVYDLKGMPRRIFVSIDP
ncbi:MAG: helicase-related protein, partial [Deltaproteobacteria bacterium]|nr:helicase-related protein [Deltaproteobacteria bacterium]